MDLEYRPGLADADNYYNCLTVKASVFCKMRKTAYFIEIFMKNKFNIVCETLSSLPGPSWAFSTTGDAFCPKAADSVLHGQARELCPERNLQNAELLLDGD